MAEKDCGVEGKGFAASGFFFVLVSFLLKFFFFYCCDIYVLGLDRALAFYGIFLFALWLYARV